MSGPAQGSGPSEADHLAAHLGDLAERVAVDTIDQVWIFPTKRVAGAYSTVIVVSAFEDDAGDRRRVLTAHYSVRVDKRGRLATQESVVEHGSAPSGRIDRLIEGVLRRLDEDLLAAPPRSAHIHGEAARWRDLLAGYSTPADHLPGGAAELAPRDRNRDE